MGGLFSGKGRFFIRINEEKGQSFRSMVDPSLLFLSVRTSSISLTSRSALLSFRNCMFSGIVELLSGYAHFFQARIEVLDR